MENKIEPEKPVERNVYEKPSHRNYVYRQLYEAAGRLKTSKPARELFGGTFVDHYAATRE
jgi:glutamine synthetase